MKKYVITCRSEEDIDLLIESLTTPGLSLPDINNDELLPFIEISNYMPFSPNQVIFNLTEKQAELIKSSKLVLCIEEQNNDRLMPHAINRQRTINPDYSSLSGTDNWGFGRCSSLSGSQPWNTDFTYYRTGSSADVVIIDSGIKRDHPDLNDDSGASRLVQENWSLYNPITANRSNAVTVPAGTEGGYYINGIQKDTIYVVKDKTQATTSYRTAVYDFQLDGTTTSMHPFFIGSAINVPFDSTYVTNNGSTTGTVSLTVFPTNDSRASSGKQDIMYYWCGNHAGMGGIITRTAYNTQADDVYFYSDESFGTGATAGHGTHCTGTVAGSAFGWATEAKIYIVKQTFYDTRYGYVNNFIGGAEAFNMVRNFHLKKLTIPSLSSRCTVTNNSYGYSTGTIIDSYNLSVSSLIAAGVHFVHSAGNDGTLLVRPNDAEFNQIRRGYYCRESSPSYPTNAWTTQYNNPVICVGALGDRLYTSGGGGNPNLKAEYSNFGTGVSLYAPGSFVNSMWPTTTYGRYNNNPLFGAYKISGTSMAGPQVAGVLACMLDDYPNLSPMEAKIKLLNNCIIGTISSSDTFIPKSGTYLNVLTYSLCGGSNFTLNQYPSKFIAVRSRGENFCNFNKSCYSKVEQINLSNISYSNLTYTNSSSNMSFGASCI
jgi:subtilisin family serine protease